MHFVPTHEEIVGLLRQTGALREGHFEYPNGLHANEYLQVALAMRYYQHAKTMSVALSRLVRANTEIRAIIPESPSSLRAPAACRSPTAFARPCAPTRFIGPNARTRPSPCAFANTSK